MVLFSNKPPLEHRLNKPSPFYSSGQDWDSHSLPKLGCIPSTVSWHWVIVIPTIDYCYEKKNTQRQRGRGWQHFTARGTCEHVYSIIPSIHLSVSQSVHQSVSQSISQPVSQSDSQSVTYSIDQSVNQSTNQPKTYSVNISVIRRFQKLTGLIPPYLNHVNQTLFTKINVRLKEHQW